MSSPSCLGVGSLSATLGSALRVSHPLVGDHGHVLLMPMAEAQECKQNTEGLFRPRLGTGTLSLLPHHVGQRKCPEQPGLKE